MANRAPHRPSWSNYYAALEDSADEADTGDRGDLGTETYDESTDSKTSHTAAELDGFSGDFSNRNCKFPMLHRNREGKSPPADHARV